jgi:Flp pilus assembly protein TadD
MSGCTSPRSARPRPSGFGASATLRTTLLAAVVLLGFGVTLFNDFAYDDDILICTNPSVKNPAMFAEHVFGSLFGNTVNEGVIKFFRPLVLTSYFLSYQVFGQVAWPFHLTNLLIHLLNGCLVFTLARCWFGLRRNPALVAALVFLAHPIQTEPVAWISGRTDLLAATGMFGTLILAWRWLRRPSVALLAALLAVYHVGLLSKELTITTPALLLMLVWTRWRVVRRAPHPIRRVAYLTALLSFFAAHMMMWRTVALADENVATFWPTGDPTTTHLTVPKVILHCARLALWPHPYVLDYSNSNFGVVNTPREAVFWLSLGGALILAALTLWLLRKRQSSGAALGWFWLTILPVSQIIPLVDLAAERYMYVPVLSLSLLAGMGWEVVRRRRPRFALTPQRAAALGAAVLLPLCLVDASRCRLWSNNLTLFSYAFEHDPYSAHKSLALAKALFGYGREAEALEVLRFHPHGDIPTQHELEALCLINLGRTEEGVAELRNALTRCPTYSPIHCTLAEWSIHSGDFDQAEQHVRAALRLRPADDHALVLLARIQRLRGEAGRAAETVAHALAMNPESLAGHVEQARLLRAQGRLDEAAASLRRGLRHAWVTVESLGTLGSIDLERQDWQGADEALTRLLAIDPDNRDALVDLGLARAQLGRPEEARELWQRALALDPTNEPARRNLAALQPLIANAAARE